MLLPPSLVLWLWPWSWTQLCLTLPGSPDSLNHLSRWHPHTHTHTPSSSTVQKKIPNASNALWPTIWPITTKLTERHRNGRDTIQPFPSLHFQNLCDNVTLTHVAESLLCQHWGKGIVMDRTFFWGAAWRDHPVLTIWQVDRASRSRSKRAWPIMPGTAAQPLIWTNTCTLCHLGSNTL